MKHNGSRSAQAIFIDILPAALACLQWLYAFDANTQYQDRQVGQDQEFNEANVIWQFKHIHREPCGRKKEQDMAHIPDVWHQSIIFGIKFGCKQKRDRQDQEQTQ